MSLSDQSKVLGSHRMPGHDDPILLGAVAGYGGDLPEPTGEHHGLGT